MTGILLAAGFSRRFGAADKLLQLLPDGRQIALAAGQNLVRALPGSIAVVRPGAHLLKEMLEEAGLSVVRCAEHELEMADSLATAVRNLAQDGSGYLVALADMPFIQPATIRAIAERLAAGATIVAPSYHGRRGHPVGFAPRFRDDLLALRGDAGARSILQAHAQEITLLPCEDAGILRDIDTPADLIQQNAEH